MRLNVVVAGDGPPIVMLHGMGSSSATWSNCMRLLAPGHLVMAVDLLGHGASPAPEDPTEYTRDRALVDIDEILATLDPAVLVGHSLGGYLALAHAATRPGITRGVVAINTGPGFRDPVKRQKWNDGTRRAASKFAVPIQACELNLQHDSVVMDSLENILTPTLVLAGDQDRPEFQRSGLYLQRRMPNARLVVIEQGNHGMHELTHAAAIAAEIIEFVATL